MSLLQIPPSRDGSPAPLSDDARAEAAADVCNWVGEGAQAHDRDLAAILGLDCICYEPGFHDQSDDKQPELDSSEET